MKAYQGEKAIISLTSWKARIKTVGLTIYSLIKNCPGFHIVLVLSEEEFPQKEAELPDDINVLADGNKIEILWVYRNYKSFKKVLFTMDKYREVPVISADDDAVYVCNYGLVLYNEYLNTHGVVSFFGRPYKTTMHTGGIYTLHPPYCYNRYGIDCLDEAILALNEDDNYYTVLRARLGLNNISIINPPSPKVYLIHNEVKPLHDIYLRRNKAIRFSDIEAVLSKYDIQPVNG